jgi:hypothetical protein
MKTQCKIFKDEKEALERVEFLKTQAIEKLDVQALAHYYAHFRVLYEVAQANADRQHSYANGIGGLLNEQSVDHKETITMLEKTFAENIRLETLLPLAYSAGQLKVKNEVIKDKTEKAKIAANSLHNKPNGSRAKAKKIQDLWASGKFASRDICAEQECAALNMSFSSARKALRNTPNP